LIETACLAKNNRKDAEDVIKSALGSLSKSALEKVEKASFTVKLVQQLKRLSEFEKMRPKCQSNFEAACPELFLGPHPNIPNVSSAVELRANKEKGRFLVAATTIDAGKDIFTAFL